MGRYGFGIRKQEVVVWYLRAIPVQFLTLLIRTKEIYSPLVAAGTIQYGSGMLHQGDVKE
jgi:hypothetical protein